MLISPTFTFESVNCCPLCGNRDSSTLIDRIVRNVPLKFSRCAHCALIYQNPRLTKESLAGYFSSKDFIQDDPTGDKLGELLGYPDYFAWDESYRKTAKLRLRRIGRFKESSGALLEIGSATGSFLDAARAFGFHVKGLDLSSTFANIARQRHNLEVDIDSIEDCDLPSSHFDVVCNWGGIACWRDPTQALANIYRSLKPDGIFALNYFNSDALPARVLGQNHFEFNHASLIVFAKRTMEQFLWRAGFSVVYSQNERQFASLGRIAGYLKLQFIHKALGAMRLKGATIPLIVPGTVFAICRKKENAK